MERERVRGQCKEQHAYVGENIREVKIRKKGKENKKCVQTRRQADQSKKGTRNKIARDLI